MIYMEKKKKTQKWISLWNHEYRDCLEYNLNLFYAGRIIHDCKVWNDNGRWNASVVYSYVDEKKDTEKLEYLWRLAKKTDEELDENTEENS